MDQRPVTAVLFDRILNPWLDTATAKDDDVAIGLVTVSWAYWRSHRTRDKLLYFRMCVRLVPSISVIRFRVMLVIVPSTP